MRFLGVSLAVGVVLLAMGGLRADEKAAKKQAADRGGPMKKKIMARFDKDGDGKLNETERAAAQEEFKKRLGDNGGEGAAKEALIKRFDKDGDGKLSDAEKSTAKEAMQKRLGGAQPEGTDKKALLKRFDKDGDGTLSESEKAAAREALGKLRGAAGKKPDAKPSEEGKDRPIPAEVLKKFDKDGDGKLNEEEKKAAYEEMKKRKKEQE